jgi:hypothetical protein
MRRIITITGDGEDDYAVVERTITGEPVYSGDGEDIYAGDIIRCYI